MRELVWLCAATAAILVAGAIWSGANFFEAVNGVVVTAFWSALIMGGGAYLFWLAARKRY